MKRFSCSCGQPVFFENSACLRCGGRLGFDPTRLDIVRITQEDGNNWMARDGTAFRYCANATTAASCNWLTKAFDADDYCLSCRLNRTIPNLDSPDNPRRWRVIEAAKRRLIYSLLNLNLTVQSKVRGWPLGLAFDFVADQRTDPSAAEEFILTHHSDGLITLNIQEADDVIRVGMRESMNERYRTVLGHFRHESGHYYFQQLVAFAPAAEEFRALFGDERSDYAAALERAYNDGPPSDWNVHYISAYAASHPSEDWAESWAHYLHITDCLETAEAYDLHAPIDGGFDAVIEAWSVFSISLNEINRSLGLADAYPFFINKTTGAKLKLVHDVVRNATAGL